MTTPQQTTRFQKRNPANADDVVWDGELLASSALVDAARRAREARAALEEAGILTTRSPADIGRRMAEALSS